MHTLSAGRLTWFIWSARHKKWQNTDIGRGMNDVGKVWRTQLFLLPPTWTHVHFHQFLRTKLRGKSLGKIPPECWCWGCFSDVGDVLDVGDVFGCWECFWMFLDVGDVFGCFWMLGMFLDVFGCFWMLEMFLDVFGHWGCFWMLAIFLDVGDVFGCFWMSLDVFQILPRFFQEVCPSNETVRGKLY